MPARPCPLCRDRWAPEYRFCCSRCYRAMPERMRVDISRAWRRRVFDPALYAETLAGVLMWHRGYNH